MQASSLSTLRFSLPVSNSRAAVNDKILGISSFVFQKRQTVLVFVCYFCLMSNPAGSRK